MVNVVFLGGVKRVVYFIIALWITLENGVFVTSPKTSPWGRIEGFSD